MITVCSKSGIKTMFPYIGILITPESYAYCDQFNRNIYLNEIEQVVKFHFRG